MSALNTSISEATGKSFRLDHDQSAGGGCINQASVITGADGRHFFVKWNSARLADMFAAEAEGLATLAEARAIRVPEPVCHGLEDDRCFLVMELLELGGRLDPARFGEGLARMHRHTAEHFGWHRDNTIGATPQINAWRDDWIDFWREQRLGFQIDLAAKRGGGSSLRDAVQAVMDTLPAFFDGYRPVPSVLHGDLWSGNWDADGEGNPVIYDPAVYFGDRETDLAMTELFGGPGQRFYDAYHATWPVDPGYRVRKDLYNLYHLLNHFNLFGGGYAGQSERLATRLLCEVR
ncbi:fructosamine kinase family protein [Thioalkalivibrio thiocyanodenitrificans]|uniref:fructosamine kinase family protein n=1 Tax=Thioalkalivibrio thiocyanodenitrificans TaxID=243063 RepID=UPI000370FC2A|nr:fructosamine kinase family protein [Thioalkalivibrio thiocyanodenitrificans]